MSDLDWAVGFRYQEKVREREAERECAAWEACGGNGRMWSERLISRRLAAGFYDDPTERGRDAIMGRGMRAYQDQLYALAVEVFRPLPILSRLWPDDEAERYAAAWSEGRG